MIREEGQPDSRPLCHNNNILFFIVRLNDDRFFLQDQPPSTPLCCLRRLWPRVRLGSSWYHRRPVALRVAAAVAAALRRDLLLPLLPLLSLPLSRFETLGRKFHSRAQTPYCVYLLPGINAAVCSCKRGGVLHLDASYTFQRNIRPKRAHCTEWWRASRI